MNFISASVTHIYRATNFCTATPNIFGSSGPELVSYHPSGASILRWLQDLWEICSPLTFTESGPSTCYEWRNRKCHALSLWYRLGTECRWGHNAVWAVGNCLAWIWGALLWPTCTVWFQRMSRIVQPLSRNTLRTHCSKPQVEAAITHDFFLVTETPTLTWNYASSSWGREYGDHWISQVSLFDVHLKSTWKWAA
jgi:hypothetical protein